LFGLLRASSSIVSAKVCVVFSRIAVAFFSVRRAQKGDLVADPFDQAHPDSPPIP